MKLRVRHDTLGGLYYLERRWFFLWYPLIITADKQKVFEKASLVTARNTNTVLQEWKV